MSHGGQALILSRPFAELSSLCAEAKAAVRPYGIPTVAFAPPGTTEI